MRVRRVWITVRNIIEKLKFQWILKIYTVQCTLNSMYWWGGGKVIYNWNVNELWLSLHPISEYKYKNWFFPIFKCRVVGMRSGKDIEDKVNTKRKAKVVATVW